MNKRKKRMMALILACVLIATTILTAVFALLPLRAGAAERPLVLCIDPGHGGAGEENAGAVYNGLQEKDITLATALAMKAELEKYENVRVYLTRASDVQMSLKERVDFAAAAGADYLISLHYNASNSHALYGAEVWVSAFGEMYRKGCNFANLALTELQALGIYPRGVKTKLGAQGDYYGILRHAQAAGIPCALIEHCYMDQPADTKYYMQDGAYQRLGVADATAAAKYFHLKSAALGVDYSTLQTPDVGTPKGVMANDTTPPVQCTVDAAVYDGAGNTVTATVSVRDNESAVIYYNYSLDGGATWSALLPWNRGLTTDTVTLPASGRPETLLLRTWNQYDLCTQSPPAAVR